MARHDGIATDIELCLVGNRFGRGMRQTHAVATTSVFARTSGGRQHLRHRLRERFGIGVCHRIGARCRCRSRLCQEVVRNL